MGKRRTFPPVPPIPDTSRLVDADGVRWCISMRPDCQYLTDRELGEKLGLSAGFIGMIRSGARRPSKAFLDAIGWEAVTLYQMKKKPLTSK